ncbi:MATE family efflux transporter [Evtepia sp.]|uniref:MATE family efflux transporter n=1 Tax=Evtepia sp. TaxID=2773933 RepID=UPI003F15C0B1
MAQKPMGGPPGGNPLGTEKISKLLVQFAIPAILSALLGAVYNLTDQAFIGQRIGYLGNAATTVAYPITIVCGAVGLLFGIGATVHFNLLQGKGKTDEALRYGANGISALVASGLSLMVLTLVFTTPILYLFGANQEVLPYAQSYLRITALGIPFLLLTNGGTLLIRADGSPRYTLLCSVVGVGTNILLDFLFLYPLGMGVEGAALATILGQILSAVLVVRYLGHMKTGKLKKEDFAIRKDRVGDMVKIGAAASLNQVAMLLSQVVQNSSLRHYGDLSVYGSSEVLAAAGVVAKVNMIFYSVIIGFSIGCEPIMGFNYGARQFDRVRETYRKTLLFVVIIGVVEFACFWLFPNQLLSVFGEGTAAYGAFAVRYMHIFLFMVAINGVAPVTMNMLSSTGNAKRGTIISLTRQIFLFIPLMLVLPLAWGLDGLLYAAPTADLLAMVIALAVVRPELRKMREGQGAGSGPAL